MEEQCVSHSKRIKMTESEVHPLLVGLVLEKVFPYCSKISLGDYRLVCKAWDKELMKIIREENQINLARLIMPYPEGLGWVANEDGSFKYECPYAVTAFENIEVTGSCESLVESNVIRWFEVMGYTVKSLKFSSSLTCFHHVRFLECVLKRWCKNLTQLHLDSVECIYTLLHNSKFVDESKSMICNLEQVTLSVEGEYGGGSDTPTRFKCCQEDLPSSYLNYSGNPSVQIKQDDQAYRAFGLKLLKRMTRDFTEDLPEKSLDFMRNTLTCDGGVLGGIYTYCSVKKFTVRKLISQHHLQDLLVFLNVRDMNSKKTIQHFDYDNFPLAFSSLYLDTFRTVKLPLTTLRFGMLFAFDIQNSLRDLLASYAETLEHLEFSGDVMLQDWVTEHDEEFIEVVIPPLPKLKTFINGNIFACRMSSLEFLKNMPILEKCSLTNAVYHSSIYPLTPAEVFNLLFQACYFETTHPLKELTLDGKLCYNNHVELMQSWFPGLVKVDLLLDGADVFVDFLRVAKNLNIEDVKVSFYANDNEWVNAGIVNNVGKMTNLKYLQLTHLPDSPLTVSAQTCEEGFAKAPKLTSLKLTNFGIFADEIHRVRQSLSHISCVQLCKTVLQFKPVDVEFSIGCERPFPFVIQEGKRSDFE